MPEVGPRIPLERFSLVLKGDVYCVVDIVDGESASLLLTPLPEQPREVGIELARALVAGWEQAGQTQGAGYEIRPENIEL
jgi:hypothetical protein